PRSAPCRKLPAAPSPAGVARRTAGAPLDSAAAAPRHAPDSPKPRPRRRTLPGPPRSSYSCPRTPPFREHVLMTPTTLALQMPFQSKEESISSLQRTAGLRPSAAELMIRYAAD